MSELQQWIRDGAAVQIIEQPFADAALSRADADSAVRMISERFLRLDRPLLQHEWTTRCFRINDLVMPIDYRVFGDKPEGGRSLYISMHGGGSAPMNVNDGQWLNQIRLYQPAEGVYLAPRAAVDDWNMWHQEHVGQFFDRIIRAAVLTQDVNPDRVYLLGYSAGGDGVYRMAPRMADRWAAAGMMAGHSGGVSLLNVRNIGMTLWMGGNDSAYGRNQDILTYGRWLDSMAVADPGGYVHETHLVEGKGHWMDRADTAAIHWLPTFTRNPLPDKVVWRQDGTRQSSFYWLAADESADGLTAIVERHGNTFTVLQNDFRHLKIGLNDEMIDFDQSVTIIVNGKTVFNSKIERSVAAIWKSIEARRDRRLVFSAYVGVPTDSVPLPSPAQLHWQEKETMMFITFDPATFQGREYDDHSFPTSEMRMAALNTDQWCRTAKSWGARSILFVAKHTGGFCWWQTETSDYGIRNTPWKNGRGDVLADLSESCRRFGLDLGIYVYPGDEQWGAGIGSGGITADPSKQEAYNRVFRQQMTEVLSRYGTVREVWFDGSCKIPVDDIIRQYAPEAVVFQGDMASLRWVGNEDGVAPYPNWYTLSQADLATGIATALQSDPDGDAYAPVEVDVPLLKHGGHKWFWNSGTDNLLLSTGELMNLYLKSVGRGAVLLLNATPDTSGLIPASHVARYREFGEAIRSAFDKPLKSASGSGSSIEIIFPKQREINCAIIQEDLSKGQRVRRYIIEYQTKNSNVWNIASNGLSVGEKRIDCFPTVNATKIRIRFTEFSAVPEIRNFAVYRLKDGLTEDLNSNEQAAVIGHWTAATFGDDWQELTFDLTPHVTAIGQYTVAFQTLAADLNDPSSAGLEFSEPRLEMYGEDRSNLLQQIDARTFRFDRSQQTLDEYRTVFRLKVRSKKLRTAGDIVLRRITY